MTDGEEYIPTARGDHPDSKDADESQIATTTTQGDAARRTFDVPEIFLMILETLAPLQLLVASGINKNAQHLITTTPSLRRAMGLAPALDNDFWVPMIGGIQDLYARRTNSHSSVALHASGAKESDPSIAMWKVHFSLSFSFSDSEHKSYPLPIAGGLGRNIFLCLPVVKTATIQLVCDHVQDCDHAQY
ncbi:uncharacterized protein LTR77_001568 [Saxophila tyrrhenica]|uniref:F-box domain-containing protein n=1 Tax=Saxophila tyrrhenica TaxID=1690608 RepID=A0AAV9PN93_9PEZI|nr:hypothetical protein LTR77_001568 [Saxophila tyrrhenica]